MLKFAVIFACFLPAACNRAPKQQSSPGAIPGATGLAQTEYTTKAANAANRLRELFNSGNCGRIYDEASDEFRELESPGDWMGVCGYLRARLGTWNRLDLRPATVWESFLAHVDGTARFSAGVCRIRIGWRIKNGEARLFSLSLNGAGQNVTIPRGPLPSGG